MHELSVERRKKPRALAARLIRIHEVVLICGLSRTSIYYAVKLGTFPMPIKIGGRATAWIKQEVDAWVEQRIADSRRKSDPGNLTKSGNGLH